MNNKFAAQLFLVFLLAFQAFSPRGVLASDSLSHKSATGYLQEKGEVYFSFPMPSKTHFTGLANRISVDRIVDGRVYAYANRDGFDAFLNASLPYEVHTHPGDVDFDLQMKDWNALQNKDLTQSWDFYPTYEAYVALMHQFEEDYPDLVQIVNIGQTVLGRDLLFAKISPQVHYDRAVPQFMYSSTMHGDETAGFVLSLRLIYHLASNYGDDEDITRLMDHAEIWICPNENPDGTYRYDNSTISGATRGNANGVDLNRNYPNPVNDPWHDQQPETTAMISFTDTMNFIMSANMHGGTELVNFPFDSWTSNVHVHADHEWWEFVMYEYVDTVHAYSPTGYMTAMGDGVTHGGDWYVVYGSRQDYFNYYRSCREFTLELSNQKMLNPALLPAHWEYNYRSLLNYIRQSTYGVHGFVYDNQTGEPLLAEISIPGYDNHHSEVYTRMPHGNYNRPLLAGMYDITFSAGEYPPVSVDGIEVVNYETIRLNVAMGENVGGQIVNVSMATQGNGSIGPFEGTQFFNHGARVFLFAEPAPAWEFDKWLINGVAYPQAEMTVVADEDLEIIAVFSDPTYLVQHDRNDFTINIFPNPVEAFSEVRIKLEQPETIRLTVCDMHGRNLGVLFDGRLPAGEHRMALFPIYNLLGQGVYILRASGENHVSGCRFVKIR